MRKAQDRDSNEEAAKAVESAIGMSPPTGVYEALLKRQAAKKATKTVKNPAAVALGKLGGLKGGKARAAALSSQERKAIARKAAKKRWENAAVAQKTLETEETRFLALKKQGLSMAQIATQMGKSPAELGELVVRLLDVMANRPAQAV